MLGFSKTFILALVIAVIVGVGTHDVMNSVKIMLFYIVAKIVWNVIT